MRILEGLIFYGLRLFILAQVIWAIFVLWKGAVGKKILAGILVLPALLLTTSLIFSLIVAMGPKKDGIGLMPYLAFLFYSELPLQRFSEKLAHWIAGG